MDRDDSTPGFRRSHENIVRMPTICDVIYTKSCLTTLHTYSFPRSIAAYGRCRTTFMLGKFSLDLRTLPCVGMGQTRARTSRKTQAPSTRRTVGNSDEICAIRSLVRFGCCRFNKPLRDHWSDSTMAQPNHGPAQPWPSPTTDASLGGTLVCCAVSARSQHIKMRDNKFSVGFWLVEGARSLGPSVSVSPDVFWPSFVTA